MAREHNSSHPSLHSRKNKNACLPQPATGNVWPYIPDPPDERRTGQPAGSHRALLAPASAGAAEGAARLSHDSLASCCFQSLAERVTEPEPASPSLRAPSTLSSLHPGRAQAEELWRLVRVPPAPPEAFPCRHHRCTQDDARPLCAGPPLLPTMSGAADSASTQILASIPGLVRRLRRGRKTEQAQAAKALHGIAVAGGEPCQRAIAAAGAIPILTQLLGSGTAALRDAAAWALARTVLEQQDLKQAFLDAGGLSPLLACFESSSKPVCAAATDCLSSFIAGSYPTCDAVREEVEASAAAIPAFVRLLCSEDALWQRCGALVRWWQLQWPYLVSPAAACAMLFNSAGPL